MVDRNLPPLSKEEALRLWLKENVPNPDYAPPLPYYHPLAEQGRAEAAATARRLEINRTIDERACFGGHDFKREAQEHEDRCRERGY